MRLYQRPLTAFVAATAKQRTFFAMIYNCPISCLSFEFLLVYFLSSSHAAAAQTITAKHQTSSCSSCSLAAKQNIAHSTKTNTHLPFFFFFL